MKLFKLKHGRHYFNAWMGGLLVKYTFPLVLLATPPTSEGIRTVFIITVAASIVVVYGFVGMAIISYRQEKDT